LSLFGCLNQQLRSPDELIGRLVVVVVPGICSRTSTTTRTIFRS